MFSKDQIIQAKLVEKVDSDKWIVSYHGLLFSVKNHTGKDFVVGESLVLQVVGLSPIEFKIINSQGHEAGARSYRRRA